MMVLLTISSVFAYQGQGKGLNRQGKEFGKQQGGQSYQIFDDTQVNHQVQIDSYPIEEISQEEIDGLLLMREEEKLARDVYLELSDLFGQQIFSNIAASEQTHTDAIKSLLIKYDLNDPVISDEIGVFENSDLQLLYYNLIEQGSSSLLDALIVGATIEDLDIKDLQELNEISDNQDIISVYNNLERGSRNHLRSFTRLIQRNGDIYEPQFITQENYDSIIMSDMETGNSYNSQPNFQNNELGDKRSNQNNELDIGRQSGEVKNNPQNQQRNSEGFFSRMWKGFKNWFN